MSVKINRAGLTIRQTKQKYLEPTTKKGPSKAKKEWKGAYKDQKAGNRPLKLFLAQKMPRAYESLNLALVFNLSELTSNEFKFFFLELHFYIIDRVKPTTTIFMHIWVWKMHANI